MNVTHAHECMEMLSVRVIVMEVEMTGLVVSQLEHTDVHIMAHPVGQCVGKYCTIHNRSDHSMRSFPQSWRGDQGFMERVCPHGVGHPDPDEITYEWLIHGCDGCCAGAYEDDTESSQSRTESGTNVTHDPLCPLACNCGKRHDEVACVACDLIAEVREDERRQSANDYVDGERDMLAKFITGLENWPVSSWQQHTQPDGTKESKRFLIDKADVLDALRALQEKP